jgi:hypothetical protein
MAKVQLTVQWKVELGAHLVQTKSIICGETKHLDRVGDHITCLRVDRGGKLGWLDV